MWHCRKCKFILFSKTIKHVFNSSEYTISFVYLVYLKGWYNLNCFLIYSDPVPAMILKCLYDRIVNILTISNYLLCICIKSIVLIRENSYNADSTGDGPGWGKLKSRVAIAKVQTIGAVRRSHERWSTLLALATLLFLSLAFFYSWGVQTMTFFFRPAISKRNFHLNIPT